jgi:hypothetical protein
MSNVNFLLFCLPEETYKLIHETLSMNAASKGVAPELRTEIASAAEMLASKRTVISDDLAPLEIILPVEVGAATDLYTYFYLALLAGTVLKDEFHYMPEANQAVKEFALEVIKQQYNLIVPDGTKATLLYRLSLVSTEDDVKSLGFTLRGSFTDFDVYDGIWLWQNEDDVEILTTNFEGQFKILGERTMELVKEIVYENRLSRFVREGDIVRPDGDSEGIFGYAWTRSDLKSALDKYPQYHVFSLIEDGKDYRIVAGERIMGARGYILVRNHVYIGDEGILLQGEAINTIPYRKEIKE